MAPLGTIKGHHGALKNNGSEEHYCSDAVTLLSAQAKMACRPGQRHGDQTRFILYVKLAVVFGLTWVFGFAAAITGIQFLWYPFIVFCGLQGAFIFLSFTFKRNVATMVRTLFRNMLSEHALLQDLSGQF